MKSVPVTRFGQIKLGDALLLEEKGGGVKACHAHDVINPGTSDEEIIIDDERNHYFIVSRMISRVGWIQKAYILTK